MLCGCTNYLLPLQKISEVCNQTAVAPHKFLTSSLKSEICIINSTKEYRGRWWLIQQLLLTFEKQKLTDRQMYR